MLPSEVVLKDLFWI